MAKRKSNPPPTKRPTSEFKRLIFGTRKENKIPKTIPGRVITSGIIRCLKSMKKTAIREQLRNIYARLSQLNPDFKKMKTNKSAEDSSTRGYLMGILVLQFRHLPFNKI